MGRPERPPRLEKSAWFGTGGKPRVYTTTCPLCRSFCRQRFTEAELVEHQRSNHANCLCCYNTFGMSRNTMRCGKGHHLCHKCTKHYIKSKCANKDFPFLCPICRDEIALKDMGHMLTSNQLREYDIAGMCRHLDHNEIFFACQNIRCRSACIVAVENCRITKTTCPSLIPCEGCDISSCFVCLATEDLNDADTNKREVNKRHLQCVALLDIKREFEAAIADGTAFKCPTCGRGGRKDMGCNNISCERCGTNWCYICHRALSASHSCSTHLHTYNLTLDQVHRRYTRQLLHEVYLRHGAEKMQRLWDHFSSIRAHGYSYAEIKESVE